MPSQALDLTKKFMRDPLTILVKQDELTLDGIKQYFIALEREDKFETLLDLFESFSASQTIIFVNTRRLCETLEDEMDR